MCYDGEPDASALDSMSPSAARGGHCPRHVRSDGDCTCCVRTRRSLAAAEDAAAAFLNLVVGGPARTTAMGIGLLDADLERQTRFRVRTFIRGAFPFVAARQDALV